jgi:RNAse (barnase) inhibitor barstar
VRWDDVRDGLTAPDLFRWIGEPDLDLERDAADAGWTVWSLDTTAVTSIDEFYGEVRAAWGLPPWFGDNLDALFDALRDATEGPSVLIWDGSRSVATVSASLATNVLAVLRDTIDESDAFAVVLRADPMDADAKPLF